MLVGAEILAALEQQPAGLLQDRGAALPFMRPVSSARTSSRALFILATMWKRSRIWRASEQFWRMSFKWRARHLKLNGEEPIMRRKVAGDQQRRRSRYDLLIITLELCNSGRSPGGAHVRSAIRPRNVAFKIEGSFG